MGWRDHPAMSVSLVVLLVVGWLAIELVIGHRMDATEEPLLPGLVGRPDPPDNPSGPLGLIRASNACVGEPWDD